MLILIVEDDPLIALDLETILIDAGHLVHGPVSSFERAIRLMERPVTPDLALVDINLIGRGTGIDVARELRARWRVHSMFVTAQEREARAHQDVALGYIRKPFTSSIILAGVRLAQKLSQGQQILPAWIPPQMEMFRFQL